MYGMQKTDTHWWYVVGGEVISYASNTDNVRYIYGRFFLNEMIAICTLHYERHW